MKKVIFMSLLSLLIFSCKSKSPTNTGLSMQTEIAIKGEWTITSVTYPGSDVIKVNSFDLADSKCFIGSQWKFISNNNKGEFSLNSSKCTSYSTPITWYINQNEQFVMKILDESKAKKVKSGYVIQVAELTENSFQLIDKVDIAGKTTNVVYQFQKINK